MKPKTKTVNFMLMDGGLGDHIGSMVAVKYVVDKYPWVTPLVWCPDYLVEYGRNVLPNTQVNGYSDVRGLYDPTKPTKVTKWDGITSPMKIHTVDYAFLKLCDENPGPEFKNYLQPDLTKVEVPQLPENFVIITTGFTADVREWPVASINAVVDYCLQQNVTPVFLGQTQTKSGGHHTITGNFREEIALDKGINLIDKTSLLQAMAIMDKSKAVLGVDNGLLHAAGCTKAPIIAGFTTVKPEIRLPYRDGILGKNCYTVVPEIDCRFCQQVTNFLYGHDYRNCYRKDELKLACTKQMTADKFISHLKELL